MNGEKMEGKSVWKEEMKEFCDNFCVRKTIQKSAQGIEKSKIMIFMEFRTEALPKHAFKAKMLRIQ